jgi:molybdopterin adenylyltransferase
MATKLPNNMSAPAAPLEAPASGVAPTLAHARRDRDELLVGLVSVSDRASAGVYPDQGLPQLRQWLQRALRSPWRAFERLVADEASLISQALVELVDRCDCDLVLTTGGTGPSRRDVTPEATLAVATRLMPGFGEQMRRISLEFVPTAILSRQVGVLRETSGHSALILNLPGQPKAIAETLEGLRDEHGKIIVPGIFAAVPYCIQLIDGPYIETDPQVVRAHRPKSALRNPAAAAPAPSQGTNPDPAT